MREDIGRICQKHPGHAENGSVYCHASLFYAHGLFAAGRTEEAYSVYRRVLSGAEGNSIQRSGQLPLYIPSLYGGRATDRNAGKTNHYFRTGSCPWFYLLTDRMLFGIKPEKNGFRIEPRMPSAWKRAGLQRYLRGACYAIEFRRKKNCSSIRVRLDGIWLDSNVVPDGKPGSRHSVLVEMPHL
jgi:cellobionic acid phosphorylase